ncbi:MULTISPECIES: hypothetical protein [Brevibacterium]|uniref:Transmembrane protein n=1 Tax=Brevibacterium salitolerans TaxID=1403566 RepID=A0ABN2X4Q9_9MICO|nr:hypothetical protein [Brevibacterium sp.]
MTASPSAPARIDRPQRRAEGVARSRSGPSVLAGGAVLVWFALVPWTATALDPVPLGVVGVVLSAFGILVLAWQRCAGRTGTLPVVFAVGAGLLTGLAGVLAMLPAHAVGTGDALALAVGFAGQMLWAVVLILGVLR